MLELGRRIELVAARKTPVLVQGPTGTGKELVARALHRLSDRATKPFVALNCAAIPESLLEAELFGHARGAFTGAVQRRTGRIESAQGGTLFLDEIGEMPLSLQAKLLRFLENGELQRVGENEPVFVDVRIVAATHQPLARRAREGSFRSDLFYRLAVFLVATPPLAERLSDLPVLVEHFLQKTSGPNARKRICREALSMLQAHTWPGNIRELQHVIERACILSENRAAITFASTLCVETVSRPGHLNLPARAERIGHECKHPSGRSTRALSRSCNRAGEGNGRQHGEYRHAGISHDGL
jgi:transcriptional regulator with GAF, ATPase, and Fis domain